MLVFASTDLIIQTTKRSKGIHLESFHVVKTTGEIHSLIFPCSVYLPHFVPAPQKARL